MLESFYWSRPSKGASTNDHEKAQYRKPTRITVYYVCVTLFFSFVILGDDEHTDVSDDEAYASEQQVNSEKQVLCPTFAEVRNIWKFKLAAYTFSFVQFNLEIKLSALLLLENKY